MRMNFTERVFFICCYIFGRFFFFLSLLTFFFLSFLRHHRLVFFVLNLLHSFFMFVCFVVPVYLCNFKYAVIMLLFHSSSLFAFSFPKKMRKKETNKSHFNRSLLSIAKQSMVWLWDSQHFRIDFDYRFGLFVLRSGIKKNHSKLPVLRKPYCCSGRDFFSSLVSLLVYPSANCVYFWCSNFSIFFSPKTDPVDRKQYSREKKKATKTTVSNIGCNSLPVIFFLFFLSPIMDTQRIRI